MIGVASDVNGELSTEVQDFKIARDHRDMVAGILVSGGGPLSYESRRNRQSDTSPR